MWRFWLTATSMCDAAARFVPPCVAAHVLPGCALYVYPVLVVTSAPTVVLRLSSNQRGRLATLPVIRQRCATSCWTVGRWPSSCRFVDATAASTAVAMAHTCVSRTVLKPPRLVLLAATPEQLLDTGGDRVSLIRNCTWAVSNLVRGKPGPALAKVRSAPMEWFDDCCPLRCLRRSVRPRAR